MLTKMPLRGGASGLAHGNKLFRCRRVDRHAVVDVFPGCAHLQRHRIALQDFVHAEADAVDADDFL